MSFEQTASDIWRLLKWYLKWHAAVMLASSCGCCLVFPVVISSSLLHPWKPKYYGRKQQNFTRSRERSRSADVCTRRCAVIAQLIYYWQYSMSRGCAERAKILFGTAEFVYCDNVPMFDGAIFFLSKDCALWLLLDSHNSIYTFRRDQRFSNFFRRSLDDVLIHFWIIHERIIITCLCEIIRVKEST